MKVYVGDIVVDEFGRDGRVIESAEFDDWIKVEFENSTEWIMVSVSVDAVYDAEGKRIF